METSSLILRQPTVHTTPLSIHPKVLFLFHFGRDFTASGKTRSFEEARLHSLREKKHPLQRSESQVHPTASSVLPRQPTVYATPLSIHPKVLLLFHFGRDFTASGKTRSFEEAQLHGLREKKHPLQRSANQVHPTDGMRVLVPGRRG
jgi:hypothetical protein